MRYQVSMILLLCLVLVAPMFAQPTEDTTKKPKALNPPTSMEEARRYFLEALELEREQKLEDSLAYYNAVVVFFQKMPNNAGTEYIMACYNNIAGILIVMGQYQEAVNLYKAGLELASKMDNYKAMAEFCHKLGVMFGQFSQVQEQSDTKYNLITPDGKKPSQFQRLQMSRGTYIRVSQIGNEFFDDRIRLIGSQNPFARQNELYTKLIRLRITGDFNPLEFLVPDAITFVIDIEKKGYDKLTRKMRSLPTDIEYTEVYEKLFSKPRPVQASITEDYGREKTAVDEITLSMIEDKAIGKPTPVTEKEQFKPGSYRLSIKKLGYDPIVEQLTIYPGEGPFTISRELKSSLRNLVCLMRSDYPLIGLTPVIPDEIHLNNQIIVANSKIKPGDYTLTIKKEGYEPIIEKLDVKPDHRDCIIDRMLKCLPREIIFEITGDYEPNKLMPPDEVTFNTRSVPNNSALKPDHYHVVVRKKGYDSDNNTIIIEPKKDAYILRRTLVSSLRKVKMDITTEYPPGMKVYPDICTLNGKDVASEENFKPGEYNLVVKRAGYETVARKIKIEPLDEPYIIKEILKAKKVRIETEVRPDIVHDDPTIKPQFTLTLLDKNKDQTPKIINSGDAVNPEEYQMKLEMDGYETQIFNANITPSEQPYRVSRTLEASLRTIITDISADYPAGPIIPDEITLDGRQITKDFKIKPGMHDLVIFKDGYNPIQKQLKIAASSQSFLIKECLEAKPRLITLQFMDSITGAPLNPSEVTFGTIRLNIFTINIKPGVYQLRSQLRGYASVDESVTVGVKEITSTSKLITSAPPATIFIKMISLERNVEFHIISDYSNSKIPTDLKKLGDNVFAEDKGTIRPGDYQLVIEKAGYMPIYENLKIEPNPAPYQINRIMISKEREVKITPISRHNNQEITNFTLMLGDKSISSGQKVKPGKYPMLFKKAGYHSLSDNCEIEPSELPYEKNIYLEPIPVLVKYEITTDHDRKTTVQPDSITLNDKLVDQKATFYPSKYILKISKNGYESIEKEIEITPKDVPHIIQETLISIPREIELIVTSDTGERVDPTVATLNTTEILGNVFRPGKYSLDVQADGYDPYRNEVTIPAGEGPWQIMVTIATIPRVVQFNITYDVPPTDPAVLPRFTFAPQDNPKNEKEIKQGDSVKPNTYIVKATKEAYELFDNKKQIWPANIPITIDVEMISKQVTIRIDIVYDVEPPIDYPPVTASFIDKVTGIPFTVIDGNKIKPSSYWLDVQQPGYDFGPRTDIDIKPSEQPFRISRIGKAKNRGLLFRIVDKDLKIIEAYEIQANGKRLLTGDTFKPGEELELVIKFVKHKTARQRIKIPPGDGPFVTPVPVEELKAYDYCTSKDEEMLDSIKYEYEFYADSQLIEKHQIEAMRSGNKVYYTAYADKTAKNLRIYAGYFFAQFPFASIKSTVPLLSSTAINPNAGPNSFTNISGDRLVDHLKKRVAMLPPGNNGTIVRMMERLVREHGEKLDQCGRQEKDEVVKYLETLTFTPPEIVVIRKVIERLKK